ncbi:MAG: phosphoribosylaminoimidazolesuccinocarboxamide synthase [Treponema sp.]|nr:phosphoribosylaminoimidazolesuccinocarboxamide synthase [Treponema sp.]
MELVKTGKFKDVYKLPDGNYLLKFKDTVPERLTCESEPCGSSVTGPVAGTGSGALKMSVYFFDLVKNANIPTHFISADLLKNEMIVQPAKLFGNGLRFVLRYKAAGCFIRRFGAYSKEGDALPKIFEVTLKDDARENPPAAKEILMALNLLSHSQFDEIHDKTVRICDIVYEDLKNRGLELFDIKVEFGIADGKIALIDEISARNMRVFKDGKRLDSLAISGLF